MTQSPTVLRVLSLLSLWSIDSGKTFELKKTIPPKNFWSFLGIVILHRELGGFTSPSKLHFLRGVEFVGAEGASNMHVVRKQAEEEKRLEEHHGFYITCEERPLVGSGLNLVGHEGKFQLQIVNLGVRYCLCR